MKQYRNQIIWIIGAGIMVGMAFVLQIASRKINGFGEWYALHVYPLLTGIVGRLFNVFSFSVVEIALYALIFLFLIYLFFHWKEPIHILTRILAFASGLSLIYTLNCGINYYRLPFSYYLNFKMAESSDEELQGLCKQLTEKLNDNWIDRESGMSIREIQEEGVRAMENLGKIYPQLDGYYPNPKPIMISQILSIQQLCGIYSPFTIEANFNQDMPWTEIPHTIAHELSHLRGFMREDEANFIGYLACIESDSPEFCYSGYLNGWIYATNALAKTNPEAYRALYQDLRPEIVEELKRRSEFWNQFDGKIAEASSKVNDTYLKINNQEQGIKSYGRVVDLMLAYYRNQ